MSQDKNQLINEVVDEIFNEFGGDRNVIQDFAEAQLQHLEQIKQQTKGYQITIRNEATSKKEEFNRVKAEHAEVQDKYGESGSNEDRIEFEKLQYDLVKISAEKLLTDKFVQTMPARALPTVSTITAKSAPARPLPTASTITTKSAPARPLPTVSTITAKSAPARPLPTASTITAKPVQKNSIPMREKFVRKPRIPQGAAPLSQSATKESTTPKSLTIDTSRSTDKKVTSAVNEALGPIAVKLASSTSIAYLDGVAMMQLRNIEEFTKELDEKNITGQERSDMIATELTRMITENKEDAEKGQNNPQIETQESSYIYKVLTPLVRLKILENYLSTIPKPEKAEIVQAQASKVEIAQATPKTLKVPPQPAPRPPVKAVSPRAEITPQSSRSPSPRTSVEKPLPPLSEGSKLSTSPRTSQREDQAQSDATPSAPPRIPPRAPAQNATAGSVASAPKDQGKSSSPRTSTREDQAQLGEITSPPPRPSSRPPVRSDTMTRSTPTAEKPESADTAKFMAERVAIQAEKEEKAAEDAYIKATRTVSSIRNTPFKAGLKSAEKNASELLKKLTIARANTAKAKENVSTSSQGIGFVSKKVLLDLQEQKKGSAKAPEPGLGRGSKKG